MLQRFSVAFLVGSLMNAATFQSIPGSGLELIPASSSEFNQYLGLDQLGPIEPILPYVVIVRNDSSPDIILFAIRWASPDAPLNVGSFSFSPHFPLNGLVLMTPNNSTVLQHDSSMSQGGGGGCGRRQG
jgi:hypothetical protein